MFELTSDFSPSLDQQNATNNIVNGVKNGYKYQTLLGVTGSGKTFTMANVIAKLNMPTLIMSHNKSLCAQLFSEFKGFFSKNHVEYFISYYDYYQPEAYIPRTDTFIEKDSSINADLERYRLSASASLLSFDDCVCIASVSANYGLGNPAEYINMVKVLQIGDEYKQKDLLMRLIEMGYNRNDAFFDSGDVRANGECIDIYPPYLDGEFIRLEFFGDEIDKISKYDAVQNKKLSDLKRFDLFATSQFIVGADRLKIACDGIEKELDQRLAELNNQGKIIEANRLKQRIEFDLEMLRTTGMTKGIENYARHLTGLNAGDTPYCLFDYFAIKNRPFLVIVDESHVSLPQFRGMYAGDRSRKQVLVDYGFRLPSALDNRPLMIDEFLAKNCFFLFVSATPAQLELDLSGEHIYEQIIRPTGLLDPIIDIVPSHNQIEHLYDQAKNVIARGERVLVTVLTKKMAKELSTHYLEMGLKCKSMDSDVDAIERNEIIRGLRSGEFDVLIGINLLREGLDLPEVSLVAILDADKEGFLRSRTSLIQTMGRAARNENARVILYADNMTPSMQQACDETARRRKLQQEYNTAHNITPRSVKRPIEQSLRDDDRAAVYSKVAKLKDKIPPKQRDAIIKDLRAKMLSAAKELEFEQAAYYRDQIAKIKKL